MLGGEGCKQKQIRGRRVNQKYPEWHFDHLKQRFIRI